MNWNIVIAIDIEKNISIEADINEADKEKRAKTVFVDTVEREVVGYIEDSINITGFEERKKNSYNIKGSIKIEYCIYAPTASDATLKAENFMELPSGYVEDSWKLVSVSSKKSD